MLTQSNTPDILDTAIVQTTMGEQDIERLIQLAEQMQTKIEAARNNIYSSQNEYDEDQVLYTLILIEGLIGEFHSGAMFVKDEVERGGIIL